MTDSFDGGITDLLCLDKQEAEKKQLQQARELSACGITGVKFEIIDKQPTWRAVNGETGASR